MVHQTATCLETLSGISDDHHGTPESGKSSISGYLVDSSSCAGLSTEPLQSVGDDHSHDYHCHQVLYSVTGCVVLCFALARHLMQMHATAHSIPRTSEVLLHGLQEYDLNLSRPLSVLLQMQRDTLNPGIWAAFLCVHHGPLLHTCEIYPHDPQNTS